VKDETNADGISEKRLLRKLFSKDSLLFAVCCLLFAFAIILHLRASGNKSV
jgi:hypothetical protein